MARHSVHSCYDKSGCGYCELVAEEKQRMRIEGRDEPTEREYDQLEEGPWWNYPPGMEPRRGW